VKPANSRRVTATGLGAPMPTMRMPPVTPARAAKRMIAAVKVSSSRCV